MASHTSIAGGAGGDLQTNMDIGYGHIRCHSNLDLTTTVTGDIALTSTAAGNLQQRLLLWMSTRRGERLESGDLGCCLQDYLHDTLSPRIATNLGMDLRGEMQDVFQDVQILSVKCKILDSRTLGLDVKMGNGGLEFVFTMNELATVNNLFNNAFTTLNSLGSIS